ncbi:IS30 family transposase [Enterococcus lactis]|uniref:IS30 family transposase n=1 Tax=Enterococcus lactis TaxID=357441 RepID=UPI0022E266B3|nr:IS30 family transposase [Enterococcus lactis]
MTQTHLSTDSRKGKHLSYAERCQIAVLKKEKYSNRQIAEALGRAPQTINGEVKNGRTVQQLRRQKQNGKTYDYYVEVYDADRGQAVYEENRTHCGRRPKWADSDAFLAWADEKMLQEKWSPDVVVGYAKEHDLFDLALIPSTATLYQWIDRGIMKITNLDLLEKLSRKPRKPKRSQRPHNRILGRSIAERPQAVENREEFGHWEIDTVIGNRAKSDAVLLTLVERSTRFEVILKLDGKDARSVDQAVQGLRERAGDAFPQLFKTITSDNGSEFAGLHAALQDVTDVYFSHPYCSWERGTSENQHRLIRRFLPKGKAISAVSEAHCLRIQQWMNDYPRRILAYRTPYDCFVQALRQEQAAA